MTRRDMLLAALTSAAWGLAFVASRYGVDGFTALQLTALRFIIAAVPALVVPRPAMSLSSLVSIGSTLFAGQFLLLFLAFRAGMPPGLAAVTQQSHVFLTVIISAMVLGERPGLAQWIGMGLAAGGLALIGSTIGTDLPVAALALALCGALSWAVGNVQLKRLPVVPMFPLIVWCSLVPPLPMLMLSAAWGEPGLLSSVTTAPTRSILGAVYLGAGATWVYAIWGRLLGRYPAVQVAPFALLSPLVGVVGAAVAFDERFALLQYFGMGLIVLGIAVIVLWPLVARNGGGTPARP